MASASLSTSPSGTSAPLDSALRPLGKGGFSHRVNSIVAGGIASLEDIPRDGENTEVLKFANLRENPDMELQGRKLFIDQIIAKISATLKEKGNFMSNYFAITKRLQRTKEKSTPESKVKIFFNYIDNMQDMFLFSNQGLDRYAQQHHGGDIKKATEAYWAKVKTQVIAYREEKVREILTQLKESNPSLYTTIIGDESIQDGSPQPYFEMCMRRGTERKKPK